MVQKKFCYSLVFLTFFCTLLASPAAFSSSLTELRSSYLKATKLLANKQLTAYRKLKPSLKDYPLYPYLLLREYRTSPSAYKSSTISKTITESQIPSSSRFSWWWINRLRSKGDWDLIVKHYGTSKDVKVQCIHTLALIKIKDLKKALPQMKDLWLVSKSQPKECDPVFEYGLKHGFIHDDLIWQRLLLTKRRHDSLTKYLTGLLVSKEMKSWVVQLNKVHRDPRDTLTAKASSLAKSEFGIDVISHGIYRLARRNPENAAKVWKSIQKKHGIAENSIPQVDKIIAQRLAWKNHDDALSWLTDIPPKHQDLKIQRWTVRIALASEDWQQVLSSIENMSQFEAARSEWRFWRARALYELGDRQTANEIWKNLSSIRSYYGFLAADRLNIEYPIGAPVPTVSRKDLAKTIESVPAVSRIREFLVLNRPYDARRELSLLRKNKRDDVFWLHATLLFHAWHWHDGALQANYRVQDKSNLPIEISHPSPYIEHVRKESVRYEVPEHWIYGIMRQESHFVSDIGSSAGAVGLMQLIPATARLTARHQKLKKPSRRDLTRPQLNIRLGVAYFKQLLNKMNGNPVYALAGYNAGPSRSNAWQRRFQGNDPAIWVEIIPFNETRNYVKKILVNFIVYETLLSQGKSKVRDYLHYNDFKQTANLE